MDKISLKDIDNIRNQGFRPQVVGCFLNDKKILLLLKKEYDLWQLPQGGIDNKETIKRAVVREMTEELGGDFVNSCKKTTTVIGEDQIEFPPSTQNTRELKNDQGKKIFMAGKKYFFVAVEAAESNIDLDKTEFDDYKWLSYNEAIELADQIYQRGKRRITINALGLLKKADLL